VFKAIYNWKIILYCHVAAQCNVLHFTARRFFCAVYLSVLSVRPSVRRNQLPMERYQHFDRGWPRSRKNFGL